MTLQLDARQRAMLEEMGVRLFWPQDDGAAGVQPEPVPAGHETPPRRQGAAAMGAAPAPAPAAAPAAAAPMPLPQPTQAGAAGPVARGASPARSLPTLAPGGDGMPDLGALDWSALADAVVSGRAAPLCSGRPALFGTGDLRARWLVVGEPPTEEEERAGEPFAGQAGKLLDNMLAAVGLSRRQGAYLTNVLKCRPAGNTLPPAEEVAQWEAVLRRQVQLLQPRVILAMGRFAVQTLLQTGEPMGRLRGQAHRYQDVPVVVTYHPAYLLRTPADKARAWADLCLARALLQD